MLSKFPPLNIEQMGETATVALLAAGLVVVVLFVVLGAMIWRFQRRFVRRWESVDKRLSEVLWRTRHSDAEELRKRTVLLEEQLTDMLQYLRTVANAIDTQLEGMSNEMKNSLSKIDRTDSKGAGQSRMVIYQLERIRKHLGLLEDAGQAQRSPARASGKAGSSGRGGPFARSEEGYRMEAVFEPIKQKIRESEKDSAEVAELLDELTWEKKPDHV